MIGRLGLGLCQAFSKAGCSVETAAAAERHRVAREMLLPRTDTMVSQEKAWIEKVEGLLSSREKGAAYLAQTAMLDMVDLPARA